MATLLEIGLENFGALSAGEIAMLRGAEMGALVQPKGSLPFDPSLANQPNQDRDVRGDVIRWLCTDKNARELIDRRGLYIHGFRILDGLYLEVCDFPLPLVIYRCRIHGELNLSHGQVSFLRLSGTHCDRIIAQGLEVKKGAIIDDGVTANGGIDLANARIGLDLDFSGGTFINLGGVAINAEGISVGGCMNMRLLKDERPFRAEGSVRISGARIGKNWDCNGGIFHNRPPRPTDATDEINPYRRLGISVGAEGIDVEGSVFLRNCFESQGEVRLTGSRIAGQLDCSRSHFRAWGGPSLCADGLTVGQGVSFENSVCDGEATLTGANIGGDLSCDGTHLDSNPDGELGRDSWAFSAERTAIKGCLFMRGADVRGNVRLTGAIIGSGFDCSGSMFTGPYALLCEGIQVGGDVNFMDKFQCVGECRLTRAVIRGALSLRRVASPEDTILDLRSAKIGVLADDRGSWPRDGSLRLHGLVYEDIHENSPVDVKSRTEWLRLQPDFHAQPYEQLAEVLQRSVHEDDGKKILIAKNEDRAKNLSWPKKTWSRFLGITIAYGYRPWRAMWFVLAIIILGWAVFDKAYEAGIMTPSQEKAYVLGSDGRRTISPDYPTFCSFAYSANTFLPVVNLQQKDYWFPNPNNKGGISITKSCKRSISGSAVRSWFWFETIAGWVLTTLFLAALAGLIRR